MKINHSEQGTTTYIHLSDFGKIHFSEFGQFSMIDDLVKRKPLQKTYWSQVPVMENYMYQLFLHTRFDIL
jgi:hypothetical protein